MTSNNNEKQIQESFPWSRSVFHSTYNQYLAQYKVESCLENIRGDSLLDLACGDGLITELFARQVSRVVGVDANGKHLREARKRLPDAEFYESLIEELELDERFDTVTMLDLLEHVVDPIVVLRKAASFLADNGVLIIHVPNAHAINRRLAVLMGTLEFCEELSPFDLEIAGHRRSYSLHTLREDIERAGLRIIKTGGIFYKILSTPQMDWFLKNGLWEKGGHGWGRVGGPQKDWKAEFCRASYELGKQHPEDCNIIYACITR
ncbi:MAG: class I SAM-dependent methyltransferase [Dehalococcoidia bacterium]|nr:class I SAM-dependent methyltransferase [Dehalococcoidia bacterium]